MLERLSNVTEEERKALWVELIKNENIEKIYISGNLADANKLWSIKDEVYITFCLTDYIKEQEIGDFTELHFDELHDWTGERFTKHLMFNRTNDDMSEEHCVYTREQGFIYQEV